MSSYSTQALAALAQQQCLNTNQTVDRKRVAGLIINELEAHHVAATMADVNQVQVDAGQLGRSIFGVDLVELVDLIKSLLAVGPDGLVQSGLTNGHMLCAGRSQIQVQMSGQVRKLWFSTRFVSADENVIKQYLLKNRLDRIEKAADGNRRLGELTITRQPALGPAVSTWTADIESAVRLALNPPATP
jgi:hypothetical protein